LKEWPFLKKGKFSQRKMLWGIIGIGLVLLLLFSGILPLIEDGTKMKDEIAMRRKNLQKYDEFLQNRRAIEEDLQRTQKQYEEIQKRLLPGETPQLGAATLQEIVKKLGDKNGIVIRSFRILELKETVPYRKVSVQIEFNPVNQMMSLGQFIHDLENHEKKLMVTEMDLLVFNVRAPNNIQGSLVVTGLMRGIKVQEKGKEGKA
jgi:hypothetical protein